MSASSPYRSQSEMTIKLMVEAELTVATEDYASIPANNDYMAHQIEEQMRDVRRHTDLKNIRWEGPC